MWFHTECTKVLCVCVCMVTHLHVGFMVCVCVYAAMLLLNELHCIYNIIGHYIHTHTPLLNLEQWSFSRKKLLLTIRSKILYNSEQSQV